MGVYNTYGENGLQLKVGDLCLKHFNIGDKVDINDGVYLEYGGVIVIKDGVFMAEYENLIDKWGGIHETDEFLNEHHWAKKLNKK